MPFDWPISLQMRGLLSTIGVRDVVDIIIIAIVLYKAYEMLKNTRAVTLGKGLVILLILTFISSWLELHVINWVLQKTVTVLFVALPIVFQPELRRALEHLGQGKFLKSSAFLSDADAEKIIIALDRIIFKMAKEHTGALIVLERDIGLDEIAETGILLDAKISPELLGNVFIVNTPLHDGAVVIRGDRILAASCILPLTERTFSTELGTRHRAAIGLSEQCDATIIVVSEETGTVSIAENGLISRHLDSKALRAAIRPIFRKERATIQWNDVKSTISNWRSKEK